jgi:hypothetical protein
VSDLIKKLFEKYRSELSANEAFGEARAKALVDKLTAPKPPKTDELISIFEQTEIAKQ